MAVEGIKTRKYTRRRFLQIVACCGAAGGLYTLGLKSSSPDKMVVRETRTMMGTQINLIVCGPDQDRCHDAVSSTLQRMSAIENQLSRHQDDSEVSRLNRHGFVDSPSDALQAVLFLSQDISMATGGAFDITVLPLLSLYLEGGLPTAAQVEKKLELVDFSAIDISRRRVAFTRQGMGVTLDGIGKGYVVDQGVQNLQQKGFDNVYVEAGGDLMVTGTKPGKQAWQIGVRNPRPENIEEMMVMRVSQPAGIATSGDYIQFFSKDLQHHHILDPRTGISPPELASATVTAPSVALADGLATGVMVLGPDRALDILNKMDGCEGLLVDKGLRRYRTSGFQV